MSEVVVVRHGETEWSRTGRHTGRTDVPLTDIGRKQAEAIGRVLAGRRFVRVLTSPMIRAVETCSLAGLAEGAETFDDLREWDYGDYEGVTTAEIRSERPGWSLWSDGCPGGESPADVGRRADRVIAELRVTPGGVVVFAHGHVLRVIAARWIGLDAGWGRGLALQTAALGVLGHERDTPVIELWNRSEGDGL